MPNQTGVVTSGSVATLTVTANDRVTVSPRVGFFAAEYPAGSSLVTGCGASLSYDCPEAGVFKIIAGAGATIDYRVVDVPESALYALSETTPYVTVTGPTAGTTVLPGACELAGLYVSVAAGSYTIYDALSNTGTPIVPATALTVGPMPIFGAGTTGKLALTTACRVVLDGAATVRVLVA